MSKKQLLTWSPSQNVSPQPPFPSPLDYQLSVNLTPPLFSVQTQTIPVAAPATAPKVIKLFGKVVEIT
jgi:hypothetical protein